MRYLLDTHIIIWFLAGNDELDSNIYDIIAFHSNIYISIVSLQEIAIKARDGGLQLKISFKEFCETIKEKTTIKFLPVTEKHLIVLNSLTTAPGHNDPFDHLIISQAVAEKMQLLSADNKFAFYREQKLDLLENG